MKVARKRVVDLVKGFEAKNPLKKIPVIFSLHLEEDSSPVLYKAGRRDAIGSSRRLSAAFTTFCVDATNGAQPDQIRVPVVDSSRTAHAIVHV